MWAKDASTEHWGETSRFKTCGTVPAWRSIKSALLQKPLVAFELCETHFAKLIRTPRTLVEVVFVNPLIVLAAGLGTVLGGILWLRLHPFLAMILGSLVVAGLTGHDNLYRAMQSKSQSDLDRDAVQRELIRDTGAMKLRGEAIEQRELHSRIQLGVHQGDNQFELSAASKTRDFASDTSIAIRITESP